MSELVYNGIGLSYVKTKSFSQEPIFTGVDQSGDYLYTHFRVSVQGLFNAPSGLPPFQAGDVSTTDMMARVRQRLWVPRETLSYSVNGRTLLQSPLSTAQNSIQAGRPTDANNGPVVRDVNVAVLNENSFVVDFDVDTWLQDCNVTGLGGNLPQFTSNRFTTDFDISRHQYVTVVTRGTVRTRGDVTVNPDSLRGVVAPTLPTGAVCEREHFAVQEDGLAVNYEFVDQEVFRVPPGDRLTPVYEATGSFSVSSPFNAIPTADLTLKLIGKKTTSPARLVQLALLLANKKMNGNPALRSPLDGDKGFMLRHVGIRQIYEENAVEITMRAQLPLPEFSRGRVPDPFYNFGNNGWYASGGKDYPNNLALNGRAGPIPLLYGTAALQANLAWLRDPCDGRTSRGPAGDALASSVKRGIGTIPDAGAPARVIKQA